MASLPTMVRSVPLSRTLIAAALLLGLGAGVQARAQSLPLVDNDRGPGPRLSEAQRLKVFPELRTLTLQDHRARIAILQQGERCITAATSPDAQRSCMRQEREATQNQRRRFGLAMREVFQRNGIPVPDWKSRHGGRRGGWDQPEQPAGGQPLR